MLDDNYNGDLLPHQNMQHSNRIMHLYKNQYESQESNNQDPNYKSKNDTLVQI